MIATTSRQFDVVVLGGTPAGVASSVASARLGQTVVLVESHTHIGGMSASGLGKSDIENRAMIGGLFREFTERVWQYYIGRYGADSKNVELCHDGYYTEPSVAETVFEQMLGEQTTITVMKGWRLEAVSVVESRLTVANVVDRQSGEKLTLQGQVFIDATYEGDLYAAAGPGFGWDERHGASTESHTPG